MSERDELVQIISRNLPRMERNFYDGTAEDTHWRRCRTCRNDASRRYRKRKASHETD